VEDSQDEAWRKRPSRATKRHVAVALVEWSKISAIGTEQESDASSGQDEPRKQQKSISLKLDPQT
jgi:hypothetical protein